MKAKIDKNGCLVLVSENDLEYFAINTYLLAIKEDSYQEQKTMIASMRHETEI